ncbi:potassium transporter [Saccharobesus litoralis]|uniref:Potassium transporter n=1 Tax=Saccharobesus litoralis TaxID=2172099 RepID=A0A2S0VTN5_9ALTE|nr:monovalent cation:proton antiporter family protein [Saccharobesus litoralis]AWB67542.1 potassium transporter [Saccharobesus litoralis]
MQDTIFKEMLLLLAASVFMISLFRRFNLTPILAYLAAGIVAGPTALGWISSPDKMNLIAELGIVLLLFSLGLEFSFPKLIAMRKMVLGTGSVQVCATLIVIMLFCFALGLPIEASFAVGAILALSSTAIVIKQLSEKSNGLKDRKGQIAVSVLLFQDIAVVPFLITFPILSQGGDVAIGHALFMALLKGIAVFVLLIAIGKWLLPRVFAEIGQARSDELFVLTTLLVALLAGGVTHLFGLSMALGAFLAGMMLGESQYKHQLEADIRPFRDILMGLFFTTVGMRLDIYAIWVQFHWLILSVVGLLLVKAMVVYAICQVVKEKRTDSVAAAIMLCQMGEFGFVLTALALENELISSDIASLLIGVGVVSMAITPFLVSNAERLTNFILFGDLQSQHQDKIPGFTYNQSDHVIICGFGRVGQTVARFLKAEAIPYVALDFDPIRVQEAQVAGERVHFGDVRNAMILNAVSIKTARLVIITLDDAIKSQTVVSLIKDLNPDAKVVVRTSDDEHLNQLKEVGATEVVPEKLEGSLMLVLHVLYRSGVPIKRIFSRLRRERRNQYNFMHGFFPGENVDLGGERREQLEFLHAISLQETAYAIGKTLKELNLSSLRAEVIGLRRNNQEIEQPPEDIRIEIDDVLIIRARPSRVEKAERFLLEG